jgi:hypothetical protein
MANKHISLGILTAVMLFFADGRSAATSWRINNNATRHAHFTDINAAMDSNEVKDGDTLYIDPGCTISSTQTASKRVSIIGAGYFLPDGTHNASVISGVLYLKSANIKLEGVTMSNSTYINADNITIERCKTSRINVGSSSYSAKYAVIRQCYITNTIYGVGASDLKGAYCTIENNIIISDRSTGCIYQLWSPTIRNNYLKETANYSIFNSLTDAIILNNIEMNTKTANSIFSSTSVAINRNNVQSSDSGREGNLFLNSIDESLIFALEGANDLLYQLKDDSPAKGFAEDGGDCGPYAGTYPYVPSGYPFGMPRFLSGSSGTRATDGKVSFSNQVTIQAK